MHKKAFFEVKPLREIPRDLADAFRTDQKAEEEYMKEFVLSAPVKIGVFRGGKIVGFYCANLLQNESGTNFPHGLRFEVSAIFVRPEYQRQGILRRFLFPSVLQESRRFKISDIVLWGMSKGTKRFFRRQSIQPRRKTDQLQFRVIRDDSIEPSNAVYGHIRFPEKRIGWGPAAKKRLRKK